MTRNLVTHICDYTKGNIQLVKIKLKREKRRTLSKIIEESCMSLRMWYFGPLFTSYSMTLQSCDPLHCMCITHFYCPLRQVILSLMQFAALLKLIFPMWRVIMSNKWPTMYRLMLDTWYSLLFTLNNLLLGDLSFLSFLSHRSLKDSINQSNTWHGNI